MVSAEHLNTVVALFSLDSMGSFEKRFKVGFYGELRGLRLDSMGVLKRFEAGLFGGFEKV